MVFANDNQEMCDWQAGTYCFGDNANLNVSRCQWNGESQSEIISYRYSGDKTPVKGCSDVAYNASNTEARGKDLRQSRELSSQSKRRRVLHFEPEAVDAPLCNLGNSSANSMSNVAEDSVYDALSQMSRWLCDESDVTSISCHEVLDPSFEGWISNCISDAEMKFSPEDIEMCGPSDVQSNATDPYDRPNGSETTVVQQPIIRTRRNVNFKGSKSLMRAPETSPASIVYPFAFVKPCGFHGDVTLKDINQRILAPPLTRAKESKEDPVCYSAFSGKPVVAKTKICTEGGRGSITIMRTKG